MAKVGSAGTFILQAQFQEALWLDLNAMEGKKGDFPPGESSAWKWQVDHNYEQGGSPRSMRREIQPQ